MVQNIFFFWFALKTYKVYRTIVLLFVLYGCETWSLTLREEPRLSVFDNRVLRKMLEPKREHVIGDCRKLHNAELYGPYTSRDVIAVVKSEIMTWLWHVACMGKRRAA